MDDDVTPPEVIVYGTVCLDRFVRIPASGAVREDSEVVELPGGEAFNTATSLAGWGVRVHLTGTALGSDPESDRLRLLLDDPALGISRCGIPDIPFATTPVCTIQVFPDGERSMQGRGYDRAVAPPPLPPSLLTPKPVFAIDPNLRTAAISAALTAAAAGCDVVAMDFLNVPEVVRVARIAVTSREWLSRSPLFHSVQQEPLAAVARIAQMGAKTALLTLGAEGCLTAARDARGEIIVQRYPAYRVPRIVDTTGAGDVFRAGLCWGLLHGRQGDWPLPRIVRFASAAAALHCMTLGGGSRPSLPAVLALAQDPDAALA